MGKRVLVIEDEPNIIEALSFILSRDGWTVHTHSDGLNANDRIRSTPPRRSGVRPPGRAPEPRRLHAEPK